MIQPELGAIDLVLQGVEQPLVVSLALVLRVQQPRFQRIIVHQRLLFVWKDSLLGSHLVNAESVFLPHDIT